MKLFKKVLVAAFIVSLAASMMVSHANAYFIPSGAYIPVRVIPPIVSTQWLYRAIQCKTPNLVVLDIRDSDSYNAGHVPGAINVPAAEWYINDPFTVPFEIPWMEMPPVDELFALIGSAGITKYSYVVVVGSTSGIMEPVPLALYNTATITRVAITLLYAGVRNVAILDGGYEKWAYEGKPVSTEPVTPKPVKYDGKVNAGMLVSMDYVASKIGKSIIIDARDEVVYKCMVQELWCAYKGHIPTARNLPTPSLWDIKTDESGNVTYITYKSTLTLWRMALEATGWEILKEVIVYCGVGGYASTTYFLLSEVFGYLNVKFYDGSAQEWTYAGMPVEC
ncbi:MAG: rhodanese-like domain-containing protein [Candidatus Bathyarchaeia archaeon]